MIQLLNPQFKRDMLLVMLAAFVAVALQSVACGQYLIRSVDECESGECNQPHVQLGNGFAVLAWSGETARDSGAYIATDYHVTTSQTVSIYLDGKWVRMKRMVNLDNDLAVFGVSGRVPKYSPVSSVAPRVGDRVRIQGLTVDRDPSIEWTPVDPNDKSGAKRWRPFAKHGIITSVFETHVEIECPEGVVDGESGSSVLLSDGSVIGAIQGFKGGLDPVYENGRQVVPGVPSRVTANRVDTLGGWLSRKNTKAKTAGLTIRKPLDRMYIPREQQRQQAVQLTQFVCNGNRCVHQQKPQPLLNVRVGGDAVRTSPQRSEQSIQQCQAHWIRFIDDRISQRMPSVVQGKDGANGRDGVNGKDGRSVSVDDLKPVLESLAQQHRGIDGRDGADGLDGRDGTDGTPGRDGQDGVNGRDASIDQEQLRELIVKLISENPSKRSIVVPEPAELDRIVDAWIANNGDRINQRIDKQVGDAIAKLEERIVPIFVKNADSSLYSQDAERKAFDPIEIILAEPVK